MTDQQKTKAQLIEELEALRRTIAAFKRKDFPNRPLPQAFPDREPPLQTIIDNLLSGMIYQVVRRPDGSRVFTYLSDTVRRFYGIAPEEGLADARLIYGKVHERDRARVFQEEEEANRTLSPFRSEVRMMGPDGDIRWSLFVSHPRRLDDGATCWDGIEFDITERKQAEEDRRENEEKFSKIFKTIPDAVAICRSRDGVYLEVNESYAQVSGYAREELVGHSPLPGDLNLWIRPEDRAPFAAALLETGEALGLEIQFRHKSGGIREALVSARVLDLAGETCHVAIISDITERKRTELALRASEEKFSRIFKTIPDPVCIIRLADGLFLEVNESFLRVTGYSREEIIGRPYYGGDPPFWLRRKDRVRLVAALRKTGEVQGLESPFQGKGGRLIYGLISARTLDIDGEACIVGIVNDITEQKQAEFALRESQRKLQFLFNTVPALIWQKDLDGRYVAVNRAFCLFLGLPAEDILGRRDHDLFPAAIADHYAASDRRILASGIPALTTVEPHLKATGETGWSHVDKLAYYDDQGKLAGTVGYALDITDRRRIEAELLQSEEKFRTIFENNASATALVDPDGTFSMVNDAYCRTSGYAREEMIGLPWTRLIAPDDLERMQAYYRLRCRDPREAPAQYEFTFVRKDGQRRQGLISPSLIPSSGQLISSVIDITEQKESERARQESRERLRALSAHLQTVREEERANISREIHDDLGQLLTGLKMDLSWILRHPVQNPAELQERARAMGQLLDQTVQTVRRISTELRPRILDDFGLIAALEWQAEEFAKKSGIACTLRANRRELTVPPDLSIAIFRIFQEALTNVARHSGATGVQASLRKEAGGLVLQIRDNGRGISEDEVNRTKSLGLVGMRERALIFGGDISIEGKKGKGTKVILRLPVVEGNLLRTNK